MGQRASGEKAARGYPGHRHEQLPIALEAQIRPDDESPAAIQLRNISSLGFIGETGASLGPESHIVIQLPGTGPCEAIVHWSAGRCIGARFVHRIDLQPLKAAAPEAF